MSRQVDPNASSLSAEDKAYLAQRGQLPTSTLSVEDQRKLLDPEANTLSLEDRVNTGDANTVNISKEEYEELLAAARKQAESTDTKALFGSTSGAPDDDEDDSDDEPLTAPYDKYTNAQLRAEIARRNEGRDEDEKIALTGTKPELVAALDEDDDEDEDDEE